MGALLSPAKKVLGPWNHPKFSPPLQQPWQYNCKELTCNEGVLDAKAETLQLLVAVELDPHEPSSGCHQSGVLHAAEAIDERRESKGPVADFDVIKAALERRLHVVILIKSQLDPLSGECCGGQMSGERKEEELCKALKEIKF